MKKILVIILVLFMGLSGCNRNDLCYEHPHGTLQVLMDWSLIPPHVGKPEGVRIGFYDIYNGKENTTYRGSDGGNVVVRDGDYNMLVINSDTEMILFEYMDDFHRAEAYLDIRSRPTYRNSPASKAETHNGIYYHPDSKANDKTQRELTIGQPDRFFATYSSQETTWHNGAQRNDTIIARPESRVMFITFDIKVKGIKNAKECRGSLSGAARSLLLSTGEPNEATGTIIFNLRKSGDTYVETVRAFGLMHSPPDTPPDDLIQHFVTLEFLLLDNSVKVYEFDVGDQIDFGSIAPEITIPLVIEEIELPDVVDPGGGDGGFDADIGDWGDIVDIPIGNSK